MRLSLDANVLVYAADANAGERHRQAVQLVRRATLGDCVLTLQTLGEFFNVVTRKGEVEPQDAAVAVESLLASFPVRAPRPGVLTVAVQAVLQHHLPFWDAMLWATVQEAGCEVLLTEDLQDGRRLGAVTFVNPFAAANQALLDRVLPAAP